MTHVSRFEDLVAWQKARVLIRVIFDLTERPAFSRNRVLVDQVQRAAISVMSNIAEGYERGSAAEFHQFLVISKASCAEVRSLLYVAHDRGCLDADEFNRVIAQSEEVSRIVGGLRSAVANRREKARPRTQS